jgi:tetratricopeptide (TPR) repeat protein
MTRLPWLALAATVPISLGMWAPTASAQSDADEERLQRAVVLFEESETLYNEGEYTEAATLLRRAYELHSDPTLLFNLARALEAGGDLGGAIDGYERYLEESPEAEDRDDVSERLQRLRRRQAELAEDAAPPEEPIVEEPPSRPLYLPPWLVAGAGAVTIGVGAVLGLRSQTKGDEAAEEPVQTTAADLHSEARSLATAANILYIAGGLALAGGVVWGVLSLGGSDADPDAEVTVIPGGAILRGRF